MAISVEYGPRASTFGGAAFDSSRDISSYDKLRGLMDMWAQIDEAKKQREHQTSERIGSQEFQKDEREDSQRFSSAERQETQTYAALQAALDRALAQSQAAMSYSSQSNDRSLQRRALDLQAAQAGLVPSSGTLAYTQRPQPPKPQLGPMSGLYSKNV